jgi:hypothetical protein
MMNVVEMICIGAVARLRRWLQGVVLAVCIGHRSQRLRSALRRHAGAISRASSARLPAVRQQFLDPTVELRGQSGQHVFQISKRVMPAELGRLQQAHHHRGTLACQLAAQEQPVFTIMGSYP